MLPAVGANLMLLGFAIAEYFGTHPKNVKKTDWLAIIPIVSGAGMIVLYPILQ